MKIYVASSWRNEYQDIVVNTLRALKHEVYDFKNPPKRTGFHWSKVNLDSKTTNVESYLKALRHPIAIDGFNSDMEALKNCDICVMVQPCGFSAALELGYAIGNGKRSIVYIPEMRDPDLMILAADLITTKISDVVFFVSREEKR